MNDNFRQFGHHLPGADYILRPSAYIVVRNSENKLAVVSTPNGFYLPGGGEESGETAEEAAVREAFEECGLRARVECLVCQADELVFAASEGKYYRKRSSFFIAHLVGVNGGGEQDHELMWLTFEEALDKLSHKSQAWAVSVAAKNKGE